MNPFSYLEIPPAGHGVQGSMLEKGVTVKRDKGIEPSFLSKDSKLNGSYLAVRESISSRSQPRSSIGELVSLKHLIRRVEWEYIRPKQCCVYLDQL